MYYAKYNILMSSLIERYFYRTILHKNAFIISFHCIFYNLKIYERKFIFVNKPNNPKLQPLF